MKPHCLNRFPRRAVLIGALWLFLRFSASAHDPGLSSATINLLENRLEALVVLAASDARHLIRPDIMFEENSTALEWATAETELARIAAGALEITIDNQSLPVRAADCRFEQENAIVRLEFSTPTFSTLEIRSAWLTRLASGHRQFLTVQDSRRVITERLLSADSDSLRIDLNPAVSAGMKSRAGGIFNWMRLGFKHIVIGYDHVLFLCSLLLVTRAFSDAVRIVTSFTVAHSVTLALATMNLVRIPSEIVEPIIAASILFVGVENLVRGQAPKGRTWVVFCFGLVHGLGFASVLRELGVGLTQSVVVPLLSFNLGVELGQLLLVGALLPLLWRLDQSPRLAHRWIPVGSAAVAAAGAFWLMQRIGLT